ncbi:MAG: hypothetical protein ACR2O4_12285 [Hyphomicrobiaceae bacterium]
METVTAILMFARWWLTIGAVVALVFLTIGIDRIDENARSSYIFRPLLVPGVLLIWPIVLWRWIVLERNGAQCPGRYKPQRRTHGQLWLVFSILIPAIFAGALLVRQTWPEQAPAVRLSPAGEVDTQ